MSNDYVDEQKIDEEKLKKIKGDFYKNKIKEGKSKKEVLLRPTASGFKGWALFILTFPIRLFFSVILLVASLLIISIFTIAVVLLAGGIGTIIVIAVALMLICIALVVALIPISPIVPDF